MATALTGPETFAFPRRWNEAGRQLILGLGHGACSRISPISPTPSSPDGTTKKLHPTIAPIVGPDDPRRFTDSGIEQKIVYDESDIADINLPESLGTPGEYPFTRGVHGEMYRSRFWTMRQYAGFATAAETNGRFKYLLEHGSTGLSMA